MLQSVDKNDNKDCQILKIVECLKANTIPTQLNLSKNISLCLSQLYMFIKQNSLYQISFNQPNINQINDQNDNQLSFDTDHILEITQKTKEWMLSFYLSVHYYLNGNEYIYPQNELFFLFGFIIMKEICRFPPKKEVIVGEKSQLNEFLYFLICDYYLILDEHNFFLNQYHRIIKYTEASLISYKFFVILKIITLKYYKQFKEYDENQIDHFNLHSNDKMLSFIILYLINLKISYESNDKIKQKEFSIFSLLFLNTKLLQPKELDGTVINDIYTVLNTCDDYSHIFKNNVIAFSSSYELLLFINQNHTSLSCFKDIKSLLYSYCIRIFDQSENYLESIKAQIKYSLSTKFNIDFIEATVLESLKLINILCKIDHTLINVIFMRMKQVYERIVMKQNGICFLEILQFFIDNYNLIIVDLDSYISDFFKIKLKENYKNEILAFLTFEFLYKNKIILKQQTQIFATYFPLIIKMFSYFPKYVNTKYFELMNYMTLPDTISELFNYILDLPAVILLIDNFDCYKPIDINMKFKHEEMFQGDKLKLIELLMRDVSYENEYQYSFDYYKTKNNQLKYFFDILISTSRVHSTTKILPKFIDKFFQVIIQRNEIANALEITQLIIERFANFHGNESFKTDIRIFLIKKLEEMFNKWPQIVTELYANILHEIKNNYSDQIKRELIIFLLWSIGDFLSISSASSNSYQDICVKSAFDCLENILMDNISMFSNQPKVDFLSIKDNEAYPVNELVYHYTHFFNDKTTEQEISNERIMAVLIITLGKLSIKFKAFTGRITKCFTEIRDNLKNKTIKDTMNEMIASLNNISIGTEYLIK